jgi:hypothetical protein
MIRSAVRPRRRKKRGGVPLNTLPYIKRTLRGVSENKRLLLLWGLFLAGMLAGARLSRNTEGFFAQQCARLFESWLDLSLSRDFFPVLRSSITTSAAFAIASVLLGISAAGLPLLGCLPLLRGLGLGVLCGKLYGEFALRGLAGSILLILPGAAASVFGLLLMCKENMDSSQAFGSAAKNKFFPEDWHGLREHLRRCAALAVFAVIGALLDASAAAIFGGFQLDR